MGHRMQPQRRRSDERFRASIQHAPNVVAVIDTKGILTYVSPSAARLLGVDSGG